jgi:hypothetical protein
VYQQDNPNRNLGSKVHFSLYVVVCLLCILNTCDMEKIPDVPWIKKRENVRQGNRLRSSLEFKNWLTSTDDLERQCQSLISICSRKILGFVNPGSSVSKEQNQSIKNKSPDLQALFSFVQLCSSTFDCFFLTTIHPTQTKTMRETNQICYESVEGVSDTWQIVKEIPNYAEVTGELLFRK